MTSHRTCARAPAFGAAALALIAAAVIWQPAHAAARPLLTLSPTAGRGGATVLVQGAGFARNATGFVTFGARRVAAIRTNRSGRYRMRLRAPHSAPGRVLVSVIVRVGRTRIPGTNRFRPRALQRAARYFRLLEPAPGSRAGSPPGSPPGSLGAPPVVVMAVGDVTMSATNQNAIAVRDVIRAHDPKQILMLGDFQYTYGSVTTILGGADTIWGPKPAGLFPLVKPTAGPVHDIKSCSESDYQAYWGVAGMQPYSFQLGTWHVISLPSAAYQYRCNTAGILAWLTQDLAAHANTCTLAFWHQPYWTRPTAEHKRNTAVKPWVQALYDAGADVILTSHQHNYQRFAPQDPNDQVDTARGLREFVVGTGGINLYGFKGSATNVEASDSATYGALQLTLHSTGYEWSFLRAAGGAFTDSGSWSCH